MNCILKINDPDDRVASVVELVQSEWVNIYEIEFQVNLYGYVTAQVSVNRERFDLDVYQLTSRILGISFEIEDKCELYLDENQHRIVVILRKIGFERSTLYP